MSIAITFLVLTVAFTRVHPFPGGNHRANDVHRDNTHHYDGHSNNHDHHNGNNHVTGRFELNAHQDEDLTRSTDSGLDIAGAGAEEKSLPFVISFEIHHGDDFVNNISSCFIKFRHLIHSVSADKTLAKFDSVQRFLKATDDVFAEVKGKTVDDAQELEELLERVNSKLTESLFGTVPAYVDLVTGGKTAVAGETRAFVPDLKSLERILTKLKVIAEGTINGTCENEK